MLCRPRIVLAILVVLTCEVKLWATAADQTNDAAILLAWKGKFVADGELGVLSTGPQAWQGAAPCDVPWFGIGCQAVDGVPRVVSIKLDITGLRGRLKVELIPYLGSMELVELSLSGVTVLGGLPPALKQLSRLRTLSIVTGNLGGTLPHPATLPPSLEVLELSGNRFVGDLSTLNWSPLPGLKTLRLQHNGLGGVLPEAALLPRGLEVIDLEGNRLVGDVPASWAQLPNLRVITLAENKFNRALPKHLPASIESLDVRSNSFKGGLPETWARLPNLRHVSASFNMLFATLPEAQRMPPNIKTLWLGSNKMYGSLPESWQTLQLSLIELDYNQIEGPLPALASLAPTLEKIYLCGNRLYGPIPSDWSRFERLTHVQLCSNQLNGSLPQVLPPRIQTLYLSGNRFSGTLPTRWAGAEHLTQLLLEDNQGLTGTVPAEWAAPGAFPRGAQLFLKPDTGLCGPVSSSLFGTIRSFSKRSVLSSLGRCASTCHPPPGLSCTSKFFSLPRAVHWGAPTHLLAFPADPAAAQARAVEFCRQLPASLGVFPLAGTIRSMRLPAEFAAQSSSWRTLDPDTHKACQGLGCTAFAVIECVSEGAKPLAPDGSGNVGCGNQGRDNIGNFNTGTGNWGSCNSGSGNVGDSSSGSTVIGDGNSRESVFGDFNLPWEYQQELTAATRQVERRVGAAGSVLFELGRPQVVARQLLQRRQPAGGS